MFSQLGEDPPNEEEDPTKRSKSIFNLSLTEIKNLFDIDKPASKSQKKKVPGTAKAINTLNTTSRGEGRSKVSTPKVHENKQGD